MNLADLTRNAFENDVRALVAFSAIPEPSDNMLFSQEILDALARLDWQTLLSIAFSKPLNIRQTMEFMDTMSNLCDQTQQKAIVSFLYAKNPQVINYIHADYKEAFAKIPHALPNNLINKMLDDKLFDK
jgi:hypothetical protein